MTVISLSNSLAFLSSSFEGNWWEQFGFHEQEFDQRPPTEKMAIEQRFKKFIQDNKAEIFDALNLSLLRGDYVRNFEFREELKALDAKINSIPLPTPYSDEAQALLESVLSDKFIKIIHKAIVHYEEFLSNVSRRISLSSREYLYSWDNEITRLIGDHSLRSDDELAFFLCNKEVASIDHFLTLPSESLFELKTYRQIVEKSLGFKKYSSALRNKIDFLIAKIVLRRTHEKKVEEKKSSTLYYIENFQEKPVDAKGLVDESFLDEVNFIQTHYELIDDWKPLIRDNIDLFKNDEYSSLTMRQLHQLVKFYKDIRPNYSALHQLRCEVEKRWKHSKKQDIPYNRYCYSVSLIYTINNEFSLFLEQEDTTEEQAKALYRTVEEFAQQTNIKNFFPEVRYLKFLVQKLEDSKNQKGLFTNLSSAARTIKQCKEISQTYLSNIEWSKENYNYVFLLPFEESLYNVRNKEVEKLFISSSFLLPLVKEKYIQEYNEYQSKLEAFTTQISVLENVEPEMQKLKSLKDELQLQKKAFEEQKQEIKNSQMKSLEVIGIFTAIVTFVAASIPSFKFIESTLQALLFMFALSSSLGMFVFMLLLTTQREERKWSYSQKLFAFILAGLSITAWTLLLLFNKDLAQKPATNENEYKVNLNILPDTINAEIDSTMRNKASGDTLKNL